MLSTISNGYLSKLLITTGQYSVVLLQSLDKTSNLAE